MPPALLSLRRYTRIRRMQFLWWLGLALLHGSCTGTREPTEPAAATEARAGATVSVAASAPRAYAPPPLPPHDNLILRRLRLSASLHRPVFVTHAGDGSGRLFIVEQLGTIRIWQDDALLPDPFLDISAKFREDVAVPESEQFLLGLAFPPDFARQAHFYVNYAVHTRNGGRHTYVSRFDVDPANPNRGLAASERVLLRIPQPGPLLNGGMLAFGPDRMLWIGLGEGGGEASTAQDPARLLGKMLRLDVLAGQDGAYRIPPDNPYVGVEGVRPEIWALGLRNPWRYSFDRVTGELWIGDVGGRTYEEIHVARTDRPPTHWNFGWPIWEGLHCRQAAQCRRPDLARPLQVFRHSLQPRVPPSLRVCAIIGGYVYRGRRAPDWRGHYLVGDWCGSIWKLAQRGTRQAPAWEAHFLARIGFGLSSFGEDEEGELYAVDYRKGSVYRLTPTYGTYAGARAAAGPPLARSVFDVHLRDRHLIVLKAPCADADTAARFFLHVFPQAAADLPAARRAAGFDNRDFWFQEYGVQRHEACWAIVPLPAYALQRLRLGQAAADASAFWSEDIVFAQGQAYGTYAGARAAAGPPLARSVFDVHLRDRHLIVLKAPCADADTAARFFLHVFPQAAADLPAARRAAGFDNRDFWFQEYGVQRHEACWAIVPLPAYALQRLRLGQADASALWSEEIVLAQE